MQVPSLGPYLHDSLRHDCRMDAARMRSEEAARCRWIGFGVGKGVTDPVDTVSVFAVVGDLRNGMHGELIQGFADVDPMPVCYEESHTYGFGDFIRWVYFADPRGGSGVLGVDWGFLLRPTMGVATSMLSVHLLASKVMKHGIPPDAELVFLNSRMTEYGYMEAFRQSMDLVTVNQWAQTTCFAHGSMHCPKCGLPSLHAGDRFCGICGVSPHNVRRLTMWKSNFGDSSPPHQERRPIPSSGQSSPVGSTPANFCVNCQHQFMDLNDRFCPKCGQPRKNV